MKRKHFSKTKYLAIFATTTLIFLIGLIIGSWISNSKLSQLDNLEQDIRADTMAIEVQYDLLAENPCEIIDSEPLAEQLYQLSSKIFYMEEQLGPDDSSVVRLKNYFSLLQLRQWLFLKQTNKQCNTNLASVLYFYSNRGDCSKCEEQGYVLTYLRKTHPNIRIYSFDINIDNIAIKTIKDLYIKENKLPILIIDGKTYYGFKNKEELENILKTKRY